MDQQLEIRVMENDALEGITDSLSNLDDSPTDLGAAGDQAEAAEPSASDDLSAESASPKKDYAADQDQQPEKDGNGEGDDFEAVQKGGEGGDDDDDDDEEWDKLPGTDWQDLLGSGQLLKKVIKPGTQSRPERGQKVTVCYRGVYNGTEFESKDEFSFILGDDDALKAFDLTVSLMDVGEVAMVKSAARFAYGDAGFPPVVPPGAEVEFEIELLSAEDALLPSEMSADEKIKYGNAKRERGNKFFQEGDYATAEKLYKRALEFADTDLENLDDPDTVDKMKELMDLRLKSLNNLVATYQKLDQDATALEYCDKVLAIDQKNIKALYRKGKILLQMKEFDGAIAAFTMAAKVEPGNATFRTELQQAKQAKASYSKKERSVYSNMLRAMEIEETSFQEQSSLDDSKAEIDVVGESPMKQPAQSVTEPSPEIEPVSEISESEPEKIQETIAEAPVRNEPSAPVVEENPPNVKEPEVKEPEVKEPAPAVKEPKAKEPAAKEPEVKEPESPKKKHILPPPKPVVKNVPTKPWWLSMPGVVIISVIVALLGIAIARNFL